MRAGIGLAGPPPLRARRAGQRAWLALGPAPSVLGSAGRVSSLGPLARGVVWGCWGGSVRAKVRGTVARPWQARVSRRPARGSGAQGGFARAARPSPPCAFSGTVCEARGVRPRGHKGFSGLGVPRPRASILRAAARGLGGRLAGRRRAEARAHVALAAAGGWPHGLPGRDRHLPRPGSSLLEGSRHPAASSSSRERGGGKNKMSHFLFFFAFVTVRIRTVLSSARAHAPNLQALQNY